jgi:hypothetical protein
MPPRSLATALLPGIAIALLLNGCTTPATKKPTIDSATPTTRPPVNTTQINTRLQPPKLLEAAINEATTVAAGTVSAVVGTTATVDITKLLWTSSPMPHPATIDVRINPDTTSIGDNGVWILDGDTPANILSAARPQSVSLRAVERVFGSLSPYEQEPAPTELATLYAKADVVAFGTVDYLSPSSATFHPVKIAKGEIDDPSPIERGTLPEQVGGPWEFTRSPDAEVYVTLYLRKGANGYEALNPVDPTLYSMASLERALAGN